MFFFRLWDIGGIIFFIFLLGGKIIVIVFFGKIIYLVFVKFRFFNFFLLLNNDI